MRTPFQSLVARAQRLASPALVAVTLVLGGCASGVTGMAGNPPAHAAPRVHAEAIYVYAFDATPAQVKTDSGIAQQVKAAMNGETAAQKQVRTATDAREQVADAIVRELQAQGLRAVRAEGPVPANQNVLIVEGQFQTIDEGKRRRRILIGLGAGKSEVGASVQILYRPASGAPVPLQSFSASADSGHMPGVAETAGVGAAAGHVATAAAVGTSLHAVSEGKRDSVSSDAKKLGERIAKQIAAASGAQGWMSAEPGK